MPDDQWFLDHGFEILNNTYVFNVCPTGFVSVNKQTGGIMFTNKIGSASNGEQILACVYSIRDQLFNLGNG